MKKNNELAKAFGKKARLLAHHLRPAAFALILGVSAALAAALLRTLFTQVVRFAVDGVLLGDLTGLSLLTVFMLLFMLAVLSA